jgi:DNA mismatch repair protein MSH3
VVNALARLDVLISLSMVAQRSGYCRPVFIMEPIIQATAMRHPMVELVPDISFVPNDIYLALEHHRHWIITGPNMGGKSVLVKQIALIVLMAHMGSYVPAASFTCGIFEMICFRSATSDRISKGISTFMMEMQETAYILNAATHRSLVVLDELGRGTSTHDGYAITYAVLDYLVRKIQCVTLLVTHYPQLKELVHIHWPLLQTAHMAYMETITTTNSIIFLFKLEDGIAERSYGLNVARLAHLHEDILQRAAYVSQRMEQRYILFQKLLSIYKP